MAPTTSAVPPTALDKEGVLFHHLRAVSLACAAYIASVLDNASGRLGYEEREAAFQQRDARVLAARFQVGNKYSNVSTAKLFPTPFLNSQISVSTAAKTIISKVLCTKFDQRSNSELACSLTVGLSHLFYRASRTGVHIYTFSMFQRIN